MSKSQPVERLCASAVSLTEGDGVSVAPAPALAPFDERATNFLADLSAALLKERESRAYPDVTTFAFFCRRANLERMKAAYPDAPERLGRGTVFHIAPSNVPINFAYSLAAALLAGNASVVKASSNDFAQTRLVCRAAGELLDGAHAALAPYVNVVMYPRERQELTEAFSAACDARVIWGGDETVRRVRQAPLPPHAFDVTFPDRYSLLAVDAKAVLAMDEKQLAQAALGFYNDTYLSGQTACTSPRLIYWLGAGEALERARERFWGAAHACAAARVALEPVVAVDKLTAACRAAIELPGARLMPMPDQVAVRVSVAELTPDVERHRCAGGFFIEYAAESLNALLPVVQRKYQTLSYLGLEPEALRAFVRGAGLRGIDRIAPIGHTMDFDLTWDGYDLIRTLSRRILAF